MEKSDMYDAILIQKQMLQITACWPQERTFFYHLRYLWSWLVDIILFATIIMELAKIIHDKDYLVLTEMLSFFATQISYLSKKLIFGLKAKKFAKTLRNVKQPSFTNYPYQSDRHIKTIIKYTKGLMRLYQMLVVGLMVTYSLKPFLTKDPSALRFTVFDLGKWIIALHIYQVYCIGAGCLVNISLDGLAIALIGICAAQFEILKDKLVNIRNWAGFTYEQIDQGGSNSDSKISKELDLQVQRRLKECIKHHLDIIEFVADIEGHYTFYFLIQFADSVLAICNTWFQFKIADDYLSIAFLIFYSMSLMLQLGIYCVYGNNLIVKSEEILSACYMSDWYNCGLEVRKTLMIIMERSKRASVLTAGKLSTLSLASYSNLLQSSYSYLALMNRLNE